MLSALVIVFREVIEAGIIVGVVLSVMSEIPRHRPWIALGVAGGLAGAALVAGFAEAISNALAGMGQELFNATILAIAVAMLTWHNGWMAHHGRALVAELRGVGAEVVSGSRSLAALAVVVAVAVLREGSEVVLFLYGVAASGGATSVGILAGGVLGLAGGVGLSALTYIGLVRIPVRYLFTVTSALIAFLAAGMAAQCVAFLQQAGVLTVLTRTVWDTSWLLPDNTILGRLLHSLIGYSDRPSEAQLLVYIAVLICHFGLIRFGPQMARKLSTAWAG